METPHSTRILIMLLLFPPERLLSRSYSLLNIGPAHPSTHGVLRIISCFNAEIIEYSYTEIGLLHRGTEKLIESLGTYYATMSYFDRLDYVSVVSQELLFVQSVEKYINCFIYLYESFIRVLLVELFRILNHALAITTHAIDIGLFTTMLWFFEEREKIYCLLELLIGSRFHLAFLYIGRNRFDVSLVFIESLFYWLLNFTRRLIELFNILSYNNIWIKRLYEIGIISREIILYFGLSGLLIRASGILLDFRLFGYEAYYLLGFNSYISFVSDCLDRYLLRFNEFIESSRIIYLCLFNILEINCGISCNHSHSKDTSCSFYGNSSTSSQSHSNFMESIIYDFLFINSSSLGSLYTATTISVATTLPPSSSSPGNPLIVSHDAPTSTLTPSSRAISHLSHGSYVSIESSKGIYSLFFCISRALAASVHLNIICSDYLSINALNKYSKNINLSDLIAVLGSIDFVLGSVDLNTNYC